MGSIVTMGYMVIGYHGKHGLVCMVIGNHGQYGNHCLWCYNGCTRTGSIESSFSESPLSDGILRAESLFTVSLLLPLSVLFVMSSSLTGVDVLNNEHSKSLKLIKVNKS